MITVNLELGDVDIEGKSIKKEYDIPESITYYYKGEEATAEFNVDEQAYIDRAFYVSARDYIRNKLVNATKNVEKSDGFTK